MGQHQKPAQGCTLTPDVTDRLRRYANLLLRWNTTLNLIAARDADTVWERHILDSLQLAPLIPPHVTRAADLGSGGGFPGLVLAIATNTPFDLIESDRRKASFLRTAILETAAPATVHACRVEEATIKPVALITARALAPLPRLLPLAARLLAPDGICLLMKGGKVADELAAVEQSWRMTIKRIPSQTHPEGNILVVSNLQLLSRPMPN